jgi:hypothetical protein
VHASAAVLHVLSHTWSYFHQTTCLLRWQLDEWMEAHEAAEEAAKRQRESAMAEEGWTVVVHAKVRAAGCSLAAAHMHSAMHCWERM